MSTSARASATRFRIPPLSPPQQLLGIAHANELEFFIDNLVNLTARFIGQPSSSGNATLSRTLRELSNAEY